MRADNSKKCIAHVGLRYKASMKKILAIMCGKVKWPNGARRSLMIQPQANVSSVISMPVPKAIPQYSAARPATLILIPVLRILRISRGTGPMNGCRSTMGSALPVTERLIRLRLWRRPTAGPTFTITRLKP